ncbi:uncharacterized protein [Apostichopus japonicus]|uniref:uncharacterized protein isoform X2 n=1 Tax=Stichopus japonicus TaxID=307972 RepID=UPI003AB29258
MRPMEKEVTNSSCGQLDMMTTTLPSLRLLPSAMLFQGYMFEGGTSIGCWNEAYGGEYDKFKLRPTSYDYNAPLSEAVTIRDVISSTLASCFIGQLSFQHYQSIVSQSRSHPRQGLHDDLITRES